MIDQVNIAVEAPSARFIWQVDIYGFGDTCPHNSSENDVLLILFSGNRIERCNHQTKTSQSVPRLYMWLRSPWLAMRSNSMSSEIFSQLKCHVFRWVLRDKICYRYVDCYVETSPLMVVAFGETMTLGYAYGCVTYSRRIMNLKTSNDKRTCCGPNTMTHGTEDTDVWLNRQSLQSDF